MKKIVLKITVEVPNDYVFEDPELLLEELRMFRFNHDVERI